MATATTTKSARDHSRAGTSSSIHNDNDYVDGGDALAAANFLASVSPGFETRTLLESIYAVTSVEEIGTDKFLSAYCVNLERLSMQAHRTAGEIASARACEVAKGGGATGDRAAMANANASDALSSLTGVVAGACSEEYVVEAFVENVDKVEALAKTLLSLEFWRENVLFRRKKNAVAADTADEEEETEVEFEIEGGERGREEEEDYDDLNDVDGGDKDDLGAAESGGLAHRLADNGNALRTAFVLHAETTIVSMLNLIFYDGVPAGLLVGSGSGSGDDVLLSLVDYCARQLIFLGSPEETNPALRRQKNPHPASRLSRYLQCRSRVDEIRDSMYDSAYQTAVASVTLSRYLCGNSEELGPSVLSRMLEVHDFPLLMVPLVEEPPWTRRRSVEKRGTGKSDGAPAKIIWEKLDERNEWKEIPLPDLLSLTKLEGQPWLALFHLTASKTCREAYGLDEYRKSRLMRLRKYVHETLVDQLPVLEALARYLDELSILGVPAAGQGVHRPSSNASSSGLLLQRVDSVRESIVGKRNTKDDGYWESVAQTQWEEIFSRVTDSEDTQLRRIASEVYGGGMEDDMASSSLDVTTPFAGVHNVPTKDDAQTIVEDWRMVISKPIHKVILQMEDDGGNALESYELIATHNGAVTSSITDTPLGPFRRLKMAISKMCKEEGEAVHPRAKVVARVHFERDPSSEDSGEVELSIDSLTLPTMEHGVSQSSYNEVGIELPRTFPSKEWRQLGDLEGKSVVLQLGFKRLSRGTVTAGSTLLRGYALSQAFLSQPVVG